MIRFTAPLAILLACALLGTTGDAGAQVLVRGNVSDVESGSGMPYANVRVADTDYGTAANADGDFAVRVDSLPVRLHVSYVGYSSVDTLITAWAGRPLDVRLSPSPLVLDEVVVSAAEADSLIQQVYRALLEEADNLRPGRAYYRQHTRNDTTYTEYVETLYQAFTSPVGVKGWSVDQGRYAINPTKGKYYMTIRDFSVFFRMIDLVQDQPADEVDALLPLRSDVLRYFDLAVERRYEQDGRRMVEVSYRPRVDTDQPAFSGRLVIDAGSYTVLRHEGSIRHPDFQPINPDARGQHVENSTLSVDMYFGDRGPGPPRLDRMLVDLSFDWVQERGLLRRRPAFRRHVETQGMLVFYDFEQPGQFGADLVDDQEQRKSDREFIDEAEYDPAYWRNHPVIARTPVENEIVRMFEESEAFDKVFGERTRAGGGR